MAGRRTLTGLIQRVAALLFETYFTQLLETQKGVLQILSDDGVTYPMGIIFGPADTNGAALVLTGAANVVALRNGALASQKILQLASLQAFSAASSPGGSGVCYGGTVATTATAGAQGAPPATVEGYIIINVAGTARKIPYYAT